MGNLNLVCSDLTCDGDQVTTIYQKRWKVAEKLLLRFPLFRHPWRSEEFHKSLKSNAALAKSPTRIITTQNKHVFMSIYAVFKPECLKLDLNLNHFALRAKLYIKATQRAYRKLQAMRVA